MQKRTLERTRILLDAAQSLLETRDTGDISLADIACQAGIPLPSAYHFFPNKTALFERLAQRFHEEISANVESCADDQIIEWQAFISDQLAAGALFQNQRPAMMRLFLGAGVSAEVRRADIQGNQAVAELLTDMLCTRFSINYADFLKTKIAIALAVCDGVWQLSYSKSGTITDEYLTEGISASISYLRRYLPEILFPVR